MNDYEAPFITENFLALLSICHLGVSKNSGTPKSSILIGFSIIFTIHFGVPLFLETPILCHSVGMKILYISIIGCDAEKI